MFDRRAVAPVVGVVLLLALSLTTVTTIMVVGTTILGDVQADSQTSQMENSMAQMSSKASLVALGESPGQSFDLGGIGNGEISVRPDAGHVKLTYEPVNESPEELFNESFGAYVYSNGETEIAFQGGGVWKKHGSGSAMLSPPEYHYRQQTLTFPIVRVVGSAESQGSATGFITRSGSGAGIYPTASYPNPVEEGTVFVEIQSDYHRAWYRFFQGRTEGTVEHYPDNQTVRVDLTVPFDSAFERPVAVVEDGGIDINGGGGGSGGPPGGVPEDWEDGQQGYPSISPTVEGKISDCETGGCEDFTEPFDNDTTYYSSGDVELTNDTEFDTTNGDITVVIDGYLDTEGLTGGDDLTITGDNNVTFYLSGGFDMGSATINDDGSATQLRIYVHSDAESVDGNGYEVDLGPGSFTGVIYAPNSDARTHGNIDFSGAIIARSLRVNGFPSTNFEHPEELNTLELDIDSSENEIKYLHVSDNRIEIDASDD